MPNCPHTNERLLTWKINNNFQFLHQKQEQEQKQKQNKSTIAIDFFKVFDCYRYK